MNKTTEERLEALEEQENVVENTLHVERYKYAAEVINKHPSTCKAEILDVACGFGYGSFILHKMTSARVIGVDSDVGAIKYANKHYKDHGIEFLVGDLTKLHFKNNSFSYIACIETIEHLGLVKAEKALCELARVLQPESILIISSPNRTVSRILYRIFGNNPYHKYEFTPNELTRKFKVKNLRVIKKAGQYVYVPLLYSLGNRKLIPLALFKPIEIIAEIGRYFLLVVKK